MSPDAYRNVAQMQASVLNWADFLSFSFSVMPTAGFGDIVPVSAAAQSATSLEAALGVLYPAVRIERLVNREFVPART
ncbi:MAG: two pore domain potassium channel family protein [Planctomycetes bacterium]|nr:two pore domain potassium channel family protein [Planctomycetota bacterium]